MLRLILHASLRLCLALPAHATGGQGPVVFPNGGVGQWDIWECAFSGVPLVRVIGPSSRFIVSPMTRLPASTDSTTWGRGGGVANITYTLPKAGHVHVRVYDATGREVAHPVNEWQPAGRHDTMFAFGLSATEQVFRYRVDCDGRKSSGKIVVAP